MGSNPTPRIRASPPFPFKVGLLGLEIEVKVRIDHHTFLELLKMKGLDYETINEEYQQDLYLDNDKCELLISDRVLRIRRVNGHTLITYKSSRKESEGEKVREEIEGPLGSNSCTEALSRIGFKFKCPNNEEELLTKLKKRGFNVKNVVEKSRTNIRVKGLDLKISLDKVSKLGEFVEIEGTKSLDFVKSLDIACNIAIPSYAQLTHVLKHRAHT